MTADERVLAPLRAEIDAVDAAMVDLLARRFAIVGEVIEHKRREGLAARLPGRVDEVLGRVRTLAEGRGCPPALAEQVWRAMIEWIIDHEERSLCRDAS